MENLKTPHISVIVDVENGGRLTSIRSLSEHQDEWIFFDPERRDKNSLLINYDDVWCGGFEELFPNDAAGEIEGRKYLDHGELWQRSWTMVAKTEYSIKLQSHCSTVPAIVEKEIILDPGAPMISIQYSIVNTSSETFPYLFKLHPAMRIETGDEILMPGGTIIPVDLDFSTLISERGPFQWPHVKRIDDTIANISIIPDRSNNHKEFIYVKDIPQGWCGLRRKRTNEEFILEYPQDVFPYNWFFMALGGWRNYYTVVMEPCTNYPKDLGAAIANGTSAVMIPNEERSFSVTIKIRKTDGQ